MSLVPNSRRRVRLVIEGEADWTQNAVNEPFAIPPVYRPQLHVQTLPTTVYLALDTTRPPFDDVRARRAVNYALDGRRSFVSPEDPTWRAAAAGAATELSRIQRLLPVHAAADRRGRAGGRLTWLRRGSSSRRPAPRALPFRSGGTTRSSVSGRADASSPCSTRSATALASAPSRDPLAYLSAVVRPGALAHRWVLHHRRLPGRLGFHHASRAHTTSTWAASATERSTPRSAARCDFKSAIRRRLVNPGQRSTASSPIRRPGSSSTRSPPEASSRSGWATTSTTRSGARCLHSSGSGSCILAVRARSMPARARTCDGVSTRQRVEGPGERAHLQSRRLGLRSGGSDATVRHNLGGPNDHLSPGVRLFAQQGNGGCPYAGRFFGVRAPSLQ